MAGFDTIKIDGLEGLLNDDPQNDDELEEEENYLDPVEDEDDGEQRSDPEEGETEIEEEEEAVDPQFAAMEAKIEQLSNMLATQSAQPAIKNTEKEEGTFDAEAESKRILEKYQESLEEMDENNRLTPSQANAFSAQVGEKLLPAMIEMVEKRYGKRTESLQESYDKMLENFSNAERSRAVGNFFSDHPEATNKAMVNALNADLAKDPQWQELLKNPNEESMKKHLEKAFSPYATQAKNIAERLNKANKAKVRKKSQVNSSKIRNKGRESTDVVGNNPNPSIRDILENELRKAMKKK